MKPTKKPRGDGSPRNVIFSATEGQVRVYWHDSGKSMELGHMSDVLDMMRDFIAQTEIGERLLRSAATGRR